MGSWLTRATRGVTQQQIRHVQPVSPKVAAGRTARVYQQLGRDFGMLAPPVSLHAPAPDTLAACWLMLRETLVATGAASRAVKETVAAAVSTANDCPYCVEVHGATLAGLRRGTDAATEPVLRVVDQWARAGHLRPGTGRLPPSLSRQRPELIGVAVTFHYLNRMVNVFLPPSPLPPGLPAPASRAAGWLAAQLMGSLARADREPGASLDLLPDAPLPPDLVWAAGRAGIAEAMARASAAIDAAGARVVPDQVRDLVLVRLAGWNGQPPGLGWLGAAVASLAERDRPVGRLALLTAMASYQVTDQTIAAVREQDPADATLIEITAWASLAAARRAGVLLHNSR